MGAFRTAGNHEDVAAGFLYFPAEPRDHQQIPHHRKVCEFMLEWFRSAVAGSAGAIHVWGIADVHVGEDESTVMAFETTDVEALKEPLEQAGFRVALVDEAYGRTLRVEHPDDPRQEAELWINETQTDTYGYTRHQG